MRASNATHRSENGRQETQTGSEKPSVHSAPFRGFSILLALAVLSAASPGEAHINALRGRLIDLVRQSDVVIVGVVTRPASLSPSGKDLSIDVLEIIRGELDQKALTARAVAHLIAGERQVIFLKREGAGFRCVQASGTRFPATPEDDAEYRRTIEGIAAALRLPQDQQVGPMRAALIPALRSKATSLRYHAALELTSLNHEGHPLTAGEREAIQQVRNAPDFDPTLEPIVEGLLREPKSKSQRGRTP